MYLERWIRLIAGTFVLLSLALGYLHHHYWHFFTAFVGLNLVQSVFTKWCLMEDILRKLGVKDKGHCCGSVGGDGEGNKEAPRLASPQGGEGNGEE